METGSCRGDLPKPEEGIEEQWGGREKVAEEELQKKNEGKNILRMAQWGYLRQTSGPAKSGHALMVFHIMTPYY